MRHMDRLDEATVDRITFRLAQQLKAQGFSSSLIFFDTTNFSTEQPPRPGDLERRILGQGKGRTGIGRRSSWA